MVSCMFNYTTINERTIMSNKGHSGQKKREKWAKLNPGLTRTEFAKQKRQKRLQKRLAKLKKRKLDKRN